MEPNYFWALWKSILIFEQPYVCVCYASLSVIAFIAVAKGRGWKARHKIASDPICLGFCKMEPNYFGAVQIYTNI